ncbi:hypothetical protein KBTX_01910 [wastewater metagenome]|uniref:HTH araC/xylS-type domain-containing protein n=2 Tax=unclassified sequences TaxID=12908 RepID=A0A5B8RFX3_9ZZZZ|nr:MULTISPECIES: AraC family transcriptional regulator [Arhodomonas]MCS4503296.1 AraC family transcriptional regulator [Arhodomonas aquaeolei]QEA05587.1 hypothetical protein KBTEX_01910 [uncultured organism]
MKPAARSRLYVPDWRPGVHLLDATVSGQPFGRHSHDAFAIGVIEHGVGGYRSRGTRYVFPRRTLSLMNPGQPHDGYAVDGRMAYRTLYVGEQALAEMLPSRPRRGFPSPYALDTGRFVSRRFAALARRMALRGHAGWRLAVDSLLLDTLDGVFVRHGRETPTTPGREPAAVRRVRDYLDTLARDYAAAGRAREPERLSLGDLATLVDLHPHYLLDVFREAVGVPPYAYWLQRRIGEAVPLLARGDQPSDVALRLGFYDQPHFARCFRRITGVTPGSVEPVRQVS